MWMNNAKISTTKKLWTVNKACSSHLCHFSAFLRFFQQRGQVIIIINFVLILIIKVPPEHPLGQADVKSAERVVMNSTCRETICKPSFCHYQHKAAQKCDYRHQLLGGPVVVEWEEPMARLEVVARIARQCWLEWENIVEDVEELRFLVSTIAIKMKILRPLRNLLRDTYHSRTDLSTHGQRLLRAGYRPAIWFYGFSKREYIVWLWI